MNKPYTFVFFGIVGSGKGTQVDLLQKYLKEKSLAEDILCAYPGNEYRKMIADGNYTGSLVKSTLEKGLLQPDFLTISVFTNSLINSLQSETVLIVDGYPRTMAQAEALESSLKFYNRTDIQVIYIEVGKEEAVKRMKLRGRSDDTDEGISKRFDEYANQVLPSMEYFKNKEGYSMHTINGEQSMENVHADIIKSLSF